MHLLTRTRRMLAVGLGLLAAACGGRDAVTGPGEAPAGTFSLELVNRTPLPTDVAMNWGTAAFRNGSLKLADDGTWQMTIRYDDIGRGQPRTLSDTGRYQEVDGGIVFASQKFGTEFTGSPQGDAVIVAYDFDGNGDNETNFTFTH